MIQVSNISNEAPITFGNNLQKAVYEMFSTLGIRFERVQTDEVITMEDCTAINDRLDMKMVKTLFLTNRQQTEFYLFVTEGDKPFRSKDFSQALGISRVSFAPAEKLQELEEKPHYMESTDERLDLRHGLGLLIVQQVAIAHNGTFKLTNIFPKGCEATLIFPYIG